MTDIQPILRQLHQNLALLHECEAKYAGNEPLDLLNQLSDHRQAISLTEQASRGEISEADWRKALRPLLAHIRNRSEAGTDCRVEIGDVGQE